MGEQTPHSRTPVVLAVTAIVLAFIGLTTMVVAHGTVLKGGIVFVVAAFGILGYLYLAVGDPTSGPDQPVDRQPHV